MTPNLGLKIVQRKNFALIRFAPGDGGDPASDPAYSALVESPRDAVVCFGGVGEVPEPLQEALGFLVQQLVDRGKSVVGAFATEKLKGDLAVSKSLASLGLFPDLLTALRELGGQSSHVSHMQFIRAFVNSALRAIFVQARTRCRRGKIQVKSEDTHLLSGDVSGIVKAEGELFSYAVILSFPEETFLKLLSRMLGQEFTEVTPEIRDGAAELMNIMHAQAKTVLNEEGAGLRPEIPFMHLGREFAGFEFGGRHRSLESGKTVVVPFESELGRFHIEVWFPEDFTLNWLRAG